MKRCNISESFKPKKGYNISKKKVKNNRNTLQFFSGIFTYITQGDWRMHAVYNMTDPDPHPDIKVLFKITMTENVRALNYSLSSII